MKYFILTISIIILSSCSSKSQEETSQTSINVVSAETISKDQQPAKTVFDFLKWYEPKANTIGSMNLVNNNGSGDTTKFYSVNFTATEKYLSLLKESGFVSDNYLNSQRTYFKSAESNFQKDPQNEGPPAGFDFDLVMQSQDFMEDLRNPDKATVTVISMDDNSAKLSVEFMYKWKLEYSLSKAGDQWLIDKIEMPAN